MEEVLARLRTEVSKLCQRPVYGMTDAQAQAALGEVRSLRAALTGLEAKLVREAAGRALPQSLGYSSTHAWLRDTCRMSKAEAAAAIKLADTLDARPLLAEAMAAGDLSSEQALAIGATLAALPERVGRSVEQAAEARLLADAATFGPTELRVLGERVLAHVAPEIAEEEERRKLEEAERRAYADRSLRLIPDRVTQRTRISGVLTAEMGAIVTAALARLDKRRPAVISAGCGPADGAVNGGPTNVVSAGGRRIDHSAAQTGGWADNGGSGNNSDRAGNGGSTTGGGFDNDGEPGEHVADDRTAAQRRADALVEICQQALGADAAAGAGAAGGGTAGVGADRPALTVTVAYDVLKQELGAGVLDSGQMVTPQTARRMACDALILPTVMGGAGQVLDLGRAQRTWTGVARRAVIIRDQGCVFPGCDRPPQWCDVHHLRYWSKGGRTDLSNAALLCGFHHHLIHHTDWQIRMATDGRPEVIPPAYVDPLRRPMRNWARRPRPHRRS